ncbi:hypothetical protein T02_6927 [Trichinella nativa]|uniref:Uncharacterized protein n=2 Tax=Trichinella TaxID=6333 RepID=A0A0V1LUS5_9BILA|nr:hypothetical protein T02_6927 [Trichinella nativa]
MEAQEGEGGEEVQDWEAMEGKCICRGYWNIVSVNQVDLFVGLTREFEDWQKIIRRLVVRKQAQKAKITNDIKIYLEFRHESQSNELKVYENLQSSILLEFTLSQHCNTSRQESWTDFESGKAKASILLRTANERRMLLRHPATRNCSAFEAAVLSFHSVIRCKESSNGRY